MIHAMRLSVNESAAEALEFQLQTGIRWGNSAKAWHDAYTSSPGIIFKPCSTDDHHAVTTFES